MDPRPQPPGWLRALPSAALWAGLLALFAAVGLALVEYAYDDAFIHFRIAENLLRLGKPYFNVDDPLMSSSSPAWTVTLAALFAVAGKSVVAVSLLNAVVSLAAAVALAFLIRAVTALRGLAADGLAAALVLPVLTFAAMGLMETPLAVLCLAGSWLLFARGSKVAFAVAGAAVFVRLELAVFALALLALNERRRVAGRVAALGWLAAGAAPLALYSLAFFGGLFPDSAKAKALVYDVGPFEGLQPALPTLWSGSVYGKIAYLAVVAAAAVALAILARRRPKELPDELPVVLGLGGAVVLASYAAARTLVFSWYVPLAVAPLVAGAAIAAVRWRSALLAALAVALLFPFGRGLAKTGYAAVADRSAYPGFALGARVRKYHEIAVRLSRACPGRTLMSSEVGALGDGYAGRTLDAVGLVSSGALPFHPMKVPEERSSGAIGAIPAGYVREARPDIIVSYDLFVESLSRSDALAEYVWVRESPYLDDDLRVGAGRAPFGGLNLYLRRGSCEL